MKCRRACAIQLREEVLPAIRTHVPATERRSASLNWIELQQNRDMYLPFDVEHPGRESFPSPVQGREDILKEANPDRLQDGIHGISTWATI